MARIVGSTFKPGIPARAGKQETAMDRALASFVSPQGVYLLAQGIGALGKLPFQSKEGGLGLMKRAAQSRNAEAQKVLQQAKQLDVGVDAGMSARGAQEQRDKIVPYEDEEMEQKRVALPLNKMRQALLAEGQREGETSAEFAERFTNQRKVLGRTIPRGETEAEVEQQKRLQAALRQEIGKPEDREDTVQGRRQLDMIKRAQEAGRDVDEVLLPVMDEGELRDKIREAMAKEEVDIADDLSDLSMDQLMALGVEAQASNRRLRETATSMQDIFGQQADPLLVQQNIEASVKRRRANMRRLRDEFRRRAAAIQEAPAVDFVEGRIAKQLAGLDPVEQKAELRRLAKSVKTQEDKDEVLDLAARFKPVRSTVADYFTSDDDLRTEFEEELGELLPTIDPDSELKRRLLRAQVSTKEAEAKEIGDKGAREITIALIEAGAKQAAAEGKRADKAAAKSKAAAKEQSKKLRRISEQLARAVGFNEARVKFMEEAEGILGGKGSYAQKYAKLFELVKPGGDYHEDVQSYEAYKKRIARMAAQQAGQAQEATGPDG